MVKKIFNIITFASLFFISIGCSHYIINQSGYIRPPSNFRYTYKKHAINLMNNEIIDTTAIYYLHNSNFYKHNDQYKNPDAYLRFYSDGHFKLQGVKDFPKLDDINDVNKGIVGYYLLIGHSVKMQIYSDIDAGSDQLEYGYVDENNDLVILNENPRTNFNLGYSEKGIKEKIEKSYFNPKVYKKLKMEGMNYKKPNW